jgi:hypothetical protein
VRSVLRSAWLRRSVVMPDASWTTATLGRGPSPSGTVAHAAITSHEFAGSSRSPWHCPAVSWGQPPGPAAHDSSSFTRFARRTPLMQC